MRNSYTATPRILYVATQLFVKQGFAATSVDQICRTTGVSKGAFFHYYKSKDEAGEIAIEFFWELVDDYLFSGLEFISSKERIERVLERFREMPFHLHFESGSLFAVMAHEVTDEQTAIRVKLAQAYQNWAGKLAALLSTPARDEEACARLARQWIAVYEGAVAQAKTFRDKTIVREQLELFRRLSLLQ